MKKQALVLIGHGGFGREVASWVAASNMAYDISGFLDDTHRAADVIGPIKDHEPLPGVQYLTCFGESPRARQNIRRQLEARGAVFATLVAPQVLSAYDLKASTNSLFLGSCSLSSSLVLGDDLLVQSMAVVGHDVTIGDGVTISSHAFIGGWTTLESWCTIHPHAVVMPRLTVGEGAVVGAGAVVTKDVEPYTTVFGAPAKVIFRRERPDA